jgi:hypothetical protein
VTPGYGGPAGTRDARRGVLDQQFNNDLHAQLAGLFDKGDDIGQLSEAGSTWRWSLTS